MKKQGFTIIEMLVVIGLIGILAVMIFALVGGARDETKEVAARQQLSQIRSQAALFYERHGLSYNNGSDIDHTGSECVSAGAGDESLLHEDDENNILELLDGIKNALGTELSSNVHCYIAGDHFSVSAEVNIDGENYCVSDEIEVTKDMIATSEGCQ